MFKNKDHHTTIYAIRYNNVDNVKLQVNVEITYKKDFSNRVNSL